VTMVSPPLTQPPESNPTTKSTHRVWLRTLIFLGVAVAVVLGSALHGMGAVPGWFSLGGMSNAGIKAPIGQHLPAGRFIRLQNLHSRRLNRGSCR
jgi:hypothetical protein